MCRENDILTIFDEVKVGMGRTGKFCAFQHEDVVPDVVTLAKTLGGGKRAVGAMVTSQELFDKAYGSKQDSTLHTSGFGGLGESCAVAIETLNVLHDEDLIGRAGRLGAYFGDKLLALQAKYPKTVLEVRGKGLFRAIRLNFHQEAVSKLIDISTNPLFKTYQTVLDRRADPRALHQVQHPRALPARRARHHPFHAALRRGGTAHRCADHGVGRDFQPRPRYDDRAIRHRQPEANVRPLRLK